MTKDSAKEQPVVPGGPEMFGTSAVRWRGRAAGMEFPHGAAREWMGSWEGKRSRRSPRFWSVDAALLPERLGWAVISSGESTEGPFVGQARSSSSSTGRSGSCLADSESALGTCGEVPSRTGVAVARDATAGDRRRVFLGTPCVRGEPRVDSPSRPQPSTSFPGGAFRVVRPDWPDCRSFSVAG
jgi:hypothetical protein